MERLRQDLKDALRGARHRPGFALAVLLTLGIGIGAVAAAFSVVDTVLIRPLPFPRADRVVGLWFRSPIFPGGLSRVRHSTATYLQWRDRSEAFASFALAEASSVTLDDGDQAVRVSGAVVTSEIFTVLGIAPSVGRSFTPDDNAPGAEPTVILGHALWVERYGRDPDLIGRTVTIDGVARRVVGVLPPSVRFPNEDARLWLPLEVDPATAARGDFVYTGWGLLRPGVDLVAAESDFQRVINTLPDAYPNAFPRALLERAEFSSLIVPLRDELLGDFRGTILIVFLSVLVVLLVVVANVTNLFVVRTEGRHRELAIRAAIGAGPARLGRSLLTEAVIYGLAGGALGLALGVGALFLVKRLGPGVIPRLHEVGLDLRIVGTVMALALAVGLAVGLITALRLRTADLHESLRAGGKAVGLRKSSLRLRWALVTGQVALALALLVNAGLLVRSFAALTSVDPGFSEDTVLGARIFLPERDYPNYVDVAGFYLDLVDELRGLPGVDGAAAVTFLPLRDGRIFYPYRFPGETDDEVLPTPRLSKVVTDGYFAAMGIPLLRGRVFDRGDLEAATDVVVVNEAFARAHWPGGEAIGQRFRYAGEPDEGEELTWFTIVGVVGDVRDRELSAPPRPIVYLPLQQRHALDRRWREMSVALRADAPLALATRVRQLVQRRDRSLPVYDVRTMQQVVSDTTARARYTMLLLVIAAAGALFLAATGLYGVLTYIVNERQREMGLRIALGARPAQVRRLVMRQALVLVGAGTVIGGALTIGMNRFLASLLYGVGLVDLPTFVGVAVMLLAVSWIAARIPSTRAASVAPAITLKEE